MSAESRRADRIAAALSTLGIEPLDVTPVAGAAAWSRLARSFRVTTSAHGVVKVRVMRDAHLAERATVFATRLDDRRVPAPIGRVGSITVERWVDGVVLASAPLRAAHVAAAADVLASVHRFAGSSGERLPREQRVAPVVARTTGQLDELAGAGRITRSESRRLQRILRDGLPVTSSWGLTHNDFCADNLVLGEDGTTVSIDNERMVRGFLEYDLGRVWYRWPMPDWAERRFLDHYRSAVGQAHAPSDEEVLAWRVVATTKGAHLRHRIDAPNDHAVAALRRLLELPLTSGR